MKREKQSKICLHSCQMYSLVWKFGGFGFFGLFMMLILFGDFFLTGKHSHIVERDWSLYLWR